MGNQNGIIEMRKWKWGNRETERKWGMEIGKQKCINENGETEKWKQG